MTLSKAFYAEPLPAGIQPLGCSAHGRHRCGEHAAYMLHGIKSYPACAKFLAEHPEIPIRERLDS